MAQQLQQQQNALMTGMMGDIMRTLGGVAEKGPKSNKQLSDDGKVTTTGLDWNNISSVGVIY